MSWKMSIKRKLMIVLIGVPSLWMACLSCSSKEGRLHCKAMEVEGGYGYVILHDNDTLICQPYVPAIGHRAAFATQEDALKIGKLVCNKLSEGQSPAVTKEEISKSGVVIQ